MNIRKNIILVLICSTFILSGCNTFSRKKTQEQKIITCATPRLDLAFTFSEKSRVYLASYYKTRRESELFYSWYASEDSNFMLSKVGRCFDRKNKHYYAVKGLLSKNRDLQKLILQNMRQGEQAKVSELFLQEYRDIFPRDIR